MAVFEEGAGKTLARVQSVWGQRGVEYADSWSTENMVPGFVDHLRSVVGNDRSRAANRLVRLGALVDTKISRITSGGAFKQDSYDDLLAYLALLTELHEQYERLSSNSSQPASDAGGSANSLAQ